MVARGRMGRRVRWRVWDGHVHIAVFKMNNQEGLTVQLMELCSVLCGSLDGREVWGRMDTYSLLCSPETITTLLISYTPIQNKKFENNLVTAGEGEGRKT